MDRSGYTAQTHIKDIISDPLFGKAGAFIFPEGCWLLDDSWTVKDVGRLLPYHTAVSTGTTLQVLDYLKDECRQRAIFFDIYSEDDIASCPAKSETGAFFFKGRPDAPFAIVLAGGGFSYIASIHESFPIALKLAQKGYNAFAIQYRISGMEDARGDLEAAISFILRHCDKLSVSSSGYSLWGSGTGGGIIASVDYSAIGIRPSCVVVEYPEIPHDRIIAFPTYACVGSSDTVTPAGNIYRYISFLNRNAINTEYDVFQGLEHGFGTGIGTCAEDWTEKGIRFWKLHQK